MKYYCCDQRRLGIVKLQGSLNGLEYIEIHDSGLPGDDKRQRTLIVKFLRPLSSVPTKLLTKDNFLITGGERIKTVGIEWIAIANALPTEESPDLVNGLIPLNEFLIIRTKLYGDFSRYTLRLVDKAGSDRPPVDFDPRLSEISFSFKVLCESDFDCVTPTICPTPPVDNPQLDYLARDYASFRRLMLDRMSILMPEWRSRNPADVLVTTVELLAYAGDQCSYQLDATATEAYFGLARKRTSLRRHARLVDYLIHEGSNARVWVRVFVNDDGVLVSRQKTKFLTRVAGILPGRIASRSEQLREVIQSGAIVFEATEDTLLYQAHEHMTFYSWGERECCLPKGSTRATLRGHYPNLKAGDVLVLAEELSPRTGLAEDADRSHRWAVRLLDVRLSQDPLGKLFESDPKDEPLDVTEIYWAEEDALPFPLCLSATTDHDHGSTYNGVVSAAYGNIVLADHGYTLPAENLGEVPASRVRVVSMKNELNCDHQRPQFIPPRFRPRLEKGPLTQALDFSTPLLFSFPVPVSLTTASLTKVMQAHGIVLRAETVVLQGADGVWSISDGRNAYRLQLSEGQIQVSPIALAASLIIRAEPQRARPAIELNSKYNGIENTWKPVADLLASDASARNFVVETEHDGSSYLRFGNNAKIGAQFTATYRIGNGTAGNISLDSIAHIVSDDERLLHALNPLPARGGIDPESAEAIRRDAPEAFRIKERAVTPEDYAEVTERHPSVQRAIATFRWTGSWHTVFLTIDRIGGGKIDTAYEQMIRNHLERYRMTGYDLEINSPSYVALKLGMEVCVKPDYFRADVLAALMRVFSSGWLPNGSPAVFHPDNFTFGQPVYLSTLYQAAQAIQGVGSVEITTFQRLHVPHDIRPMEEGVLKIDRLEIAQLDNDPNFPDRGIFLKPLMKGGK